MSAVVRARTAKKSGGALGIDRSRATWRTSERGEAQRPYRLWDAEAKRYIRYRCYTTEPRAHNAALIEVRWNPVGTAVEVVDCRTGRLIGQYVHRVNGIDYLE